MYTVYVLRDSMGRLYKGLTNNLQRRLQEHRSGQTKSTSHMGDLRVVYTEEFKEFAVARSREVYLKTAAGRRFLKQVMRP
ncbi:MAG TPA: GIY-YIG nuclease family protein [Candidatus Paceibacterota bacterium]